MTSTDTLAFGVLHAAYSLGRTVPGDLSVVGFDDILLASHTVPALTTLRMPTADDRGRGRPAGHRVRARRHAARPPVVKVIAPSLIVRQSTAPPGSLTGSARRAAGLPRPRPGSPAGAS